MFPLTKESVVATAKFVALVAVPLGEVTLIGPVVAPVGAAAVICKSETTVNAVAAVPLKLTLVTPVKLVPAMVTTVPTSPLVGVKDEMVGDGASVKLVLLVAVPPKVVTEIGPAVAPVGTVAVICVGESTVNKVAGCPLNSTAVAPVKLVPVIATLVPTLPLVGLKDVIEGGGGPGMATLTMPRGRTEVPEGSVDAEKGVKGCRMTNTVKCVTEAVNCVPSALSTAVKPVLSYWLVSGL